jgi:hypothetical protein
MKSSVHSRRWAQVPPLKWMCAYRWRIGIRSRTNGTMPEGSLNDFTFLHTPIGHFHADPFITEHEGRIFLFYEDYSYLTRTGKLSCAELDHSCRVLETRAVLERPYHISYPHVFAVDGNYYMIPETAAANRVELYSAVRFPWEWHFEKVLLTGQKLFDATTMCFGGQQWIFAGGSSTGASGHYDQLNLFHAPTIFERFTAHPGNPVKTDLGSCRPAGAIIAENGQLMRPAQDCSRWYGSGLKLMEIDTLNESAYSERPITGMPGSWLRGSDLGTHTYNRSEHFEVVDILSYGIQFAAVIGRARSLMPALSRPAAHAPSEASGDLPL